MSTNPKADPTPSGDETMTGAQASYLKTLCEEAGEVFHEGLTKAEASRRIEELQEKTGAVTRKVAERLHAAFAGTRCDRRSAAHR